LPRRAFRIVARLHEIQDALFTERGVQVSTTHVWAVEIDVERFACELRREGRWFRVEFDPTRPVAAPPQAWSGCACPPSHKTAKSLGFGLRRDDVWATGIGKRSLGFPPQLARVDRDGSQSGSMVFMR
jgi:hypothetical protein